MKIFFRLPRIGIITAPIDQIFGIVPSVNSLALYLLDDPLFVGSLEFNSQPLFVEEIDAHYSRIWRYTHSHGKGGEILKVVYEMRWNQITLRRGAMQHIPLHNPPYILRIGTGSFYYARRRSLGHHIQRHGTESWTTYRLVGCLRIACAPCFHNPLQFVSLCEYAWFRNGFGVYHRFAN